MSRKNPNKTYMNKDKYLKSRNTPTRTKKGNTH